MRVPGSFRVVVMVVCGLAAPAWAIDKPHGPVGPCKCISDWAKKNCICGCQCTADGAQAGCAGGCIEGAAAASSSSFSATATTSAGVVTAVSFFADGTGGVGFLDVGNGNIEAFRLTFNKIEGTYSNGGKTSWDRWNTQADVAPQSGNGATEEPPDLCDQGGSSVAFDPVTYGEFHPDTRGQYHPDIVIPSMPTDTNGPWRGQLHIQVNGDGSVSVAVVQLVRLTGEDTAANGCAWIAMQPATTDLCLANADCTEYGLDTTNGPYACVENACVLPLDSVLPIDRPGVRLAQ